MIPLDAKIRVLTWPDLPKRMRSKTFLERKAERITERQLAADAMEELREEAIEREIDVAIGCAHGNLCPCVRHV